MSRYQSYTILQKLIITHIGKKTWVLYFLLMFLSKCPNDSDSLLEGELSLLPIFSKVSPIMPGATCGFDSTNTVPPLIPPLAKADRIELSPTAQSQSVKYHLSHAQTHMHTLSWSLAHTHSAHTQRTHTALKIVSLCVNSLVDVIGRHTLRQCRSWGSFSCGSHQESKMWWINFTSLCLYVNSCSWLAQPEDTSSEMGHFAEQNVKKHFIIKSPTCSNLDVVGFCWFLGTVYSSQSLSLSLFSWTTPSLWLVERCVPQVLTSS